MRQAGGDEAGDGGGYPQVGTEDRRANRLTAFARAYGAGEQRLRPSPTSSPGHLELNYRIETDGSHIMHELQRQERVLSDQMAELGPDPTFRMYGDEEPQPMPMETVSVPPIESGQPHRQWILRQLRIAVINYQLAYVRYRRHYTAAQWGVYTNQLPWDAGVRAIEQLQYPELSEFGLTRDEWDYAYRQGWTVVI